MMKYCLPACLAILNFSAVLNGQAVIEEGLPGSPAARAAYYASIYPRTIEFSGYTWFVKTSNSELAGPGPNVFSDSGQNVWVDEWGRLHLRITKTRLGYCCAEVISALSLGHGTYRWYLDTAVDALDPKMVLGLFTWSDTSPYANGEIDIEFSRWGNRRNPNAQYVVQPYDEAGHLARFNLPFGLPQTRHAFTWAPSAIAFESVAGHPLGEPDPGAVLQQWVFPQPGPPATDENARMNLWLYQGLAPAKAANLEIVIRAFEFIPLQ